MLVPLDQTAETVNALVFDTTREADRFEVIAIENRTGCSLALTNISFSHGGPGLRPPDPVIPAQEAMVCCVTSQGLGGFSGVEGSLTYSGEDVNVTASFDVPVLGENTISMAAGGSMSQLYDFTQQADSGNAAAWITGVLGYSPPTPVDPLVDPPITQGTWVTITNTHELVGFQGSDGQPLVLDYEPGNGSYRVWNLDLNVLSGADPFPGPPVSSGTSRLLEGTKVVATSSPTWLLVWNPDDGSHVVATCEARSENDFGASQACTGQWASIRDGHVLIELALVSIVNPPGGGVNREGWDRFLDWVPASGAYRVWGSSGLGWESYVSTAADPLPRVDLVGGPYAWRTITAPQQLVPLGPNSHGVYRMLDWTPSCSQTYRVWTVDTTVHSLESPLTSDPLPTLLTQGHWNTIGKGHTLTYMGLGTSAVLDTVATESGALSYRLWRIRDF